MSDASGALDNVKEAFHGKRGKILLFGGGAVVIAYVWWTRRNGTPETPAADDPTTADGPSGRTPQTDPEVGNTSDTGTLGPRKYANNADWLADGTSFLQGRGTPAGNAYDALTKALGGLQLTAQEIAWVSQVIGALGAPPEGMPPLNAGAPPSSTQPAVKPAPGQQPAAGSKRGYGWYKVVRGDSATGISKKYKISVALFYAFNGINRLSAGEYVKVRAASNPVLGPYKGK